MAEKGFALIRGHFWEGMLREYYRFDECSTYLQMHAVAGAGDAKAGNSAEVGDVCVPRYATHASLCAPTSL